MRPFRNFWRRLIGAWGVPQYELEGVEQVAQHVLSRIESTGGSRQLYHDWVASEFQYPLRAVLWGAARNRRGHMLLNLLVVAGGFAVSGIATASGSNHGSAITWVIFGLGLLLALFGAMNTLFRPAQRANQRMEIALELREEGWAFALASPPYDGSVPDAFQLFQQRVSALHRRLVQATALDTTQPTAAEPKGRAAGEAAAT